MSYRKSLLKAACLLLLLPTVIHAESLRIGSIASEYVTEVKKFKPLTDYLSIHLAEYGFDNIEIVITNSIEGMADNMRTGKVDLFIDSPYPALMVSEQSHSTMVLRRWKKGVAQYHSVIFTRKDSPINTLEDLKGQRIAFEEPFSTASYFLGKSELIRRGLQPIEEPGDKKIVTDNSVLYHFSGSDKSTISWVLRNRVEAGIINNHKFDSLKERIRSRLKVIHHSPAVPRHVVSFRPGFSADTISQISRVLIAMESDRTGQSVLQQFQKTKKFDLISKQTQQNLQQLKDMIQKITPP